MGLVSDRRTIAARPPPGGLLLPARRPHRGAHRGHPRRDRRPGREPGADHADHQRRRPRDPGAAANGAEPAPTRCRGHDGPFVAMYVGAHGTYSSLETVLDAADHLRDDDVRLVLVGGGDRKPALVDEAERRRPATTWTSWTPCRSARCPGWLARADVCLLPYQDNELFAGALPNKAFDYLGAGAADRGRRAPGRADADGRAAPPAGWPCPPRTARRWPAPSGPWPPTGRGARAHGRERAALRPGALRPGGAGRPLRGAGGVDCRPIAPGLDRRAGGRARQARRSTWRWPSR